MTGFFIPPPLGQPHSVFGGTFVVKTGINLIMIPGGGGEGGGGVGGLISYAVLSPPERFPRQGGYTTERAV